MSIAYSMTFHVENFDPGKADAIMAAVNEEWGDENGSWREDACCKAGSPERLVVVGDGNLCAGESEEEFTDRVSAAIWAANGGFCEVAVHATCLEELPYTTHWRTADDFDRWQEEERKATL